MKKVIDMTVGSPFKNILVFAIPIALGYMLQNTYALGDVLIVSHALSAEASTGVNLTGSLTFLVLGFAQGIAAGFGILLSQFVGAKDKDNMRKSLAASIVLGIIVGLIVATAATALSRVFLELMDTPKEFIEHADGYVKAIFIGIPFTMFYNISDQTLRAMGDSKTPLYTLIFCAVLNVGLNSLLFIWPSLTAAWAGWATVISQGISAIIGFVVIFKKFPELHVKKSDFKVDLKFAWKHLAMGIPMALQFMITASGCMVQQQSFNTLSAPAPMAQANASKIDNIFCISLNGVGTSMATYCGQNYGAKNMERVKKGFIAALGVGGIFTVIAMLGNTFLAVPLSKILLPAYKMNIPEGASYTSDDVYNMIFRYNALQSIFYYFLFLIYMCRQSIQGIGQSTVAMLGGVIEFISRVVAAPILSKSFGYIGACFSNPIAWFTGGIGLFIAFWIVFRYTEKKINKEQLINKPDTSLI